MTPSAEAQPRITLWMMDLAQPLAPGPVLQTPVVFARVGPEAAQELALAMEHGRPAVILQRFARGRHCYIGRIAGILATYGWITFDAEEIGEVNLTIRLKAGEAYIWHCATLPAYRGQRLYAALLIHMLRMLQQTGQRRAWIGTDGHNLSSQNGVALAGFRPVCDIFLSPAFSSQPAWLCGHPSAPSYLVQDARAVLPGASTDVKPYS